MVPTAGVERTSVELCASLADSGTSIVLDGSVEVLRALGSRSNANELVQFLKCCYEAEDEGFQVTTVAVLVLELASVVDNWFAGSGKQMTVQTEDVAALMQRLPSKKRFPRVDPGTKLMCSIGAIRQKRARTITSFVRAHRGGSSFAGFADSSCRIVMIEVVANSVAWSRRVFAGSDARRICISADEFNGESSRMILICRDLCSNALQVMPRRVEKRPMVFFCSFFHFTSAFLIQRGVKQRHFLPFFDFFFHHLTVHLPSWPHRCIISRKKTATRSNDANRTPRTPNPGQPRTPRTPRKTHKGRGKNTQEGTTHRRRRKRGNTQRVGEKTHKGGEEKHTHKEREEEKHTRIGERKKH